MSASAPYDVVIVGSGLAGLTAALTAARLGHRTMVVTGAMIGGQLISIERVDGHPDHPDGIPGYDIGPMVQEEAAAAGAEFVSGEAHALVSDGSIWRLETDEGPLSARSVIIATGAAFKSLGVPNEAALRGRGLSDCATCDGPMLKGKTVIVVGGGDSGLQEALTLTAFVERVVIVERHASLPGQARYREVLERHSKVEIRCGQELVGIVGEDGVSGAMVRDVMAGTVSEIPAAAVFAFVGLVPSTAWLAGQLALDETGAIVVDAEMRTSLRGALAAGTCRAGAAFRALGSSEDGVDAAEAADRYLRSEAWS